jgi:two-component system, chemotaxis family, sensor kinase CheA
MAVAARGIAQHLGKGEIRVVCEPNGLRLHDRTWSPVWSSFMHLMRNPVDHGLEPPEARRALGKPEAGTIRMSTCVVGDRFVIEIDDDGAGIKWQQVAESARKAGLPHGSQPELLEALFETGVSTKETVDEYSGRGIGFGAVRKTCERMGGALRVDSDEGKGTKIALSWPLSALRETQVAELRAS